MGRAKRAALYLRVSTDGQTVQNQRPVLKAVAGRRGRRIVATSKMTASAVLRGATVAPAPAPC
jgi:DNA invertase Pin-like site-specific DNA recombinase